MSSVLKGKMCFHIIWALERLLQGSSEDKSGVWCLTTTSCGWMNLALIFVHSCSHWKLFLHLWPACLLTDSDCSIHHSKDLNLPRFPHKSNVLALNYYNHWHEKRWLTAFKFQRVFSILNKCRVNPNRLLPSLVTCLLLNQVSKNSLFTVVTGWNHGQYITIWLLSWGTNASNLKINQC